jgi:GntR family transcriptional regulator, transcriptional repressor for pyruvate dehydrogenase complex
LLGYHDYLREVSTVAESHRRTVSFTRVEREMGLTDRVANQLLEMIAARQVRPGDRLPPEREIGEALGVSRTVVREAIRALTGKGVLTINSGRGVTVSEVNTDNVAEAMRLFIETRGGYHEEGPFSYEKIHEVREMLEVRVATVAAQRATEEDLEELRAAFQALTEATDSPELSSIRDVEFHRTIAKIAHNELYMVMLDSIGHVLLKIREETLVKRARRQGAIAFHKRILDAIERGDSEAAGLAMSDHLQDSANLWRSIGQKPPRASSRRAPRPLVAEETTAG